MKPQISKWATVIIAVLFATLIIVPLIRNDIGLARNPQNYMSLGWQEATQYLRSQLTLEQDAEYYKAEHFKFAEVQGMYMVQYETTISDIVPCVLAWWDYGYWIVREAHMPVICSPGGGERKLAAKLLLNEDPNEVITQLKALNIKYIVIDSQTVVEKFYAVVQLVDLDLKEQGLGSLDLDRYYDIQNGELFRTAEYYRTFLAQAYLFDAKRISGMKLVYVSGAKVMFEDGYLSEVKVFEVQ